jgi:hypothetical protein
MKIKQPSVIGEMIAGIVLGPSLVGMYFPEFSAFLFQKNHWETTVSEPDRAYSLHVYCRNGAGSECFKKKSP